MAQIEEIFVPALENLNLPVKVEPPDDENRENDPGKYLEDPSEDRVGEKIGEIFRMSDQNWRFVCFYCVHECDTFPNFTKHIEEHLKTIAATSLGIKPELRIDDLQSLEGSKEHELDSDESDNVSDSCGSDTKRNRNVVKITSPDSVACPDCGKSFINASNMKRHRKLHASQKVFSCKMCDKTFAVNQYLLIHMKVRHKIKENYYSCEICGEEFTFNLALKKHMKSHSSGNVKDKDSETANDNDMQKEIIETYKEVAKVQENGGVRFPCTECGLTFSNIHNMRRHMDNIHHGINPEKICRICNKRFDNKADVREHIRTVHNIENVFRCTECRATFKYQRNLDTHRLKHTDQSGERKYLICEYCQKGFPKKGNLRKHMIVHIPKPYRVQYTCHICAMTFDRQNNLIRHVNNHDPTKHATCQFCKKTFRKEYMSDHLKTHTNERPYQCSVCGKTFNISRGLEMHMTCHTKVRKYKCDLCPKTYLRAYQLTVHRRTHTGDFIYNCFDCNRGFAEKRSLKKHMISHHGRPLEGYGEKYWKNGQATVATTST